MRYSLEHRNSAAILPRSFSVGNEGNPLVNKMAHPHAPEPFFVVRPSAREITSIKFIPGNNGSDELLSYGYKSYKYCTVFGYVGGV